MAQRVKNFACNAGDIRDTSLIPESGRSSRGRNGNPLQFLAWEIPWTEAAVHGVAKESNMT